MGGPHGVRTPRAARPTPPPASPDLLTDLADAVRRAGLAKVCSVVPLSPETVLRILAGQRVHRGSMALLSAHASAVAALRATS
jgi:hypothetical protein